MKQYKVFILLIQVFLGIQLASAGFDRIGQPSSVFSRAFSGVAMNTPDNLSINPASVAGQNKIYAAIFYSPSPFQLSQLSNYGILGAMNVEYFDIGASINSFGFSLYRETSSSIVLAKRLYESFDVGIGFHISHLFIDQYGSATTIVFDIGGIYNFSENLKFGFSLQNLSRATFGGDDDIPQVLSTGISYKIIDQALVNFDVVKDIRYEPALRPSIEFSPHEILIVRAGIQTGSSRLFGGIGLRIIGIGIDYGIATHAELGLTHSIGIKFPEFSF